MTEILDTLLEVTISEEEDFLKIKETLTRIGIASKKDKILYQSCHILHKRGRYYIVHFKELFLLDGKPSNFTDEDRARRNTIATLLEEWDLLKILQKDRFQDLATLNRIKILPHWKKTDWLLEAKYSIGTRKNR